MTIEVSEEQWNPRNCTENSSCFILFCHY